VFSIGHWQPRIGDPSFVGWFTVFSYYLCAGLALVYLLQSRQEMNGAVRRFRIVIPVVVLILGISKHINLPGAVTEIGRLLAFQLGGYEARRSVQVLLVFVVVIGLLLLIRRWLSQKALRVVWERGAPEIICLFYLGGLVVLRAISLHHIGALLSAEVFGVRLNWIVELAGIYALFVILLVRIFSKPSAASACSV
jgi:hypothetical protein